MLWDDHGIIRNALVGLLFLYTSRHQLTSLFCSLLWWPFPMQTYMNFWHHQIIKGTFKDHLVTWVGKYLELEHGPACAAVIMADIDRRYVCSLTTPILSADNTPVLLQLLHFLDCVSFLKVEGSNNGQVMIQKPSWRYFVCKSLPSIYIDQVPGLPTCHCWPRPSADGTCSERVPWLLLSSLAQCPQRIYAQCNWWCISMFPWQSGCFRRSWCPDRWFLPPLAALHETLSFSDPNVWCT